MLLETDYSSEAFKKNMNILLLLTGSFPPKPLKITAHGLPKISQNLSSNGPAFDKKGFLFSNIGIKQAKMGTEASKIALNAHVHLRTANQQMSRLNAMWTTSLTCGEVAGFVRTLPIGVHFARRLGCLRSLPTKVHEPIERVHFVVFENLLVHVYSKLHEKKSCDYSLIIDTKNITTTTNFDSLGTSSNENGDGDEDSREYLTFR